MGSISAANTNRWLHVKVLPAGYWLALALLDYVVRAGDLIEPLVADGGFIC